MYDDADIPTAVDSFHTEAVRISEPVNLPRNPIRQAARRARRACKPGGKKACQMTMG